MTMHIRDGAPSDHAMLVEIWDASRAESHSGTVSPDQRGIVETQLREAETGRYRLRVAEFSGARAGFTLVERHSGLIETIAILPSRWGEGLPRLLIEDAKAHSRGQLTLFVGQQSASTIRFYHKQGFDIVGEGTSPVSGLPTFRMDWKGSSVMP